MKKNMILLWTCVASLFLLLLAIGGVTYAWFTFNPYTNVEPISSTVSDGEVALLIAADPGDGFETQCTLPESVAGDLQPLSTADLESFYTFALQNRQGITTGYRDGNALVDTDTIHGLFYLESLKDNCDVYFYRPGMNFGEDAQMLAALRLGLKINIGDEIKTYIFALNTMGDTFGATSLQTTAQEGVVVSSILENGSPVYAADPARELTSFFAVPPSGQEKVPRAGQNKLCTIQAGQVAIVEYWLYLEGCDSNCVNEVQGREASIQLSFAGVTGN